MEMGFVSAVELEYGRMVDFSRIILVKLNTEEKENLD